MNFASFDLNLLRVFDALMRERSATRAGEMIGLSQPAVSNALSRLRHHFADELFVRRGNDMVPTPRAEALATTIQKALQEIEGAIMDEEPFRPEELERVFTLCGADFFATLILPKLHLQVARTSPGVTLRMIEGATGEVETLLRDSTVDMALERDMPMDADWVSSAALMQSEFRIVAAEDHLRIRDCGIMPGSALPLDLYCELSHALRSVDGSLNGVVDTALAGVGRSRRVVLALPHFHAVAVAVSKSRLVAALPRQLAEDTASALGLAIYRPPVDIPPQKLRLYWHRRHDRSPVHKWLRTQIFRTVEAMAAP
ncbi:LysR family transcriptional regulator [Roseibium salinum]|uniref:LysR family transcriptional regulator n=1 Tax=Roseibium salinum TaxID=1604349 RepID=A0ABT3QYQ4_9HYPH|nr:LysR family transcriptional regulator [Roseibium sp. DSM 29163]MCX2722085.1 LysR family transcriptional regulator [Roseibium sp. DSM 29163]MDN3719898.1 LysR family transcriptional regulator [Roseibium salinum]